jgi:crossover junction endodeoxyribonuclease RuvC
MRQGVRVIGIDPGLRSTGWGVIDSDGTRLTHVANGALRSTAAKDLAFRLVELFDGLNEVLATHRPLEAAVECTFVNKNAESTLKLGQARAMALLAPARAGLSVDEYAPNLIKKAVVGAGHADKEQVRSMVDVLLPGISIAGADAADALAIAICHAHHGFAARRRSASSYAAQVRRAAR